MKNAIIVGLKPQSPVQADSTIIKLANNNVLLLLFQATITFYLKHITS